MLKISKMANWLIPGLSFKRWLLLTFAGLTLLATGIALLLNLQPVSQLIEAVRALATIFPAHYSGPVFIGLGCLLFYFGSQKTYRNVREALIRDGNNRSGLFEALYRQNKLLHGPRIVAIGGGTGLSTLLRGLKKHTSNITAVVTVGDDGGSSGRLREEHSIIPPGDIRNCVAALADEEQLITSLFQYRFKTGSGLEGHSFGNLFLTAMCQITGDMFSAIKESSKVLNISGRVLPSTLDNIKLSATMADGSVVIGESQIPEAKGRIQTLESIPKNPKTLPEVVEAIHSADIIILGPGSLYTSVMPNIIIQDIAKAISESKAPKLYIANIMTQPGETDGYSVGDHLQAILDHAPYPGILDGVIVNNALPEALLKRYIEYGHEQVKFDPERIKAMGIAIVEKLLVDEREQNVIRHNPTQLGKAVVEWYKKEYNGNGKNRSLISDQPKVRQKATSVCT
ncbi:MAG: gluconeogenesis factor YvcK family protein [Cyanobacteria bacterium P01_H01_bin.74]